MPRTSSTFPLADRIYEGHLGARLRQWKKHGDSFETIARRLATEKDIHVSSTTVYRWCVDLGIAGHKKAS